MWFVWSYIKETEATTDRRALTQSISLPEHGWIRTCVWLILDMVNGWVSESLWGKQIPHYGVNIDSYDDVMRGRLLKCRALQGWVGACLMNTFQSVGLCGVCLSVYSLSAFMKSCSYELAWSQDRKLCEGKTSDGGLVTRQGQKSGGRW